MSTGPRTPASLDQGRSGFTLIETLVAMMVFAVNASAMLALLSLSFTLLREATILLQGLDALDVLETCGAALVATRRGTRYTPRPRSGTRRLREHRRCGGVTLVEMLIALALATVVLLSLGSLVRATTTAGRGIEDRFDRATLDHGLRLVFEGDMVRAGGGLADDECGLTAYVGDRQLTMQWRSEDSVLHTVRYVAGVDASGRPALYRRHQEHARQPWLEDVTGFEIADIEVIEQPGAEARPARAAAVVAAIEHVRYSDMLRWRVELPHQPCLGGPNP